MKRLTTTIGILLIVGLFLTEAHSILYIIAPDIANEPVNVFIDPPSFQISLEWVVLNICQSLYIICLAFAGAKASIYFSSKLFRIMCVAFCYGVVDLFMFFYNYKREPYMFYVLVAACISSIVFLIMPEKKKSKYKSLV